MEVGDLRHVPLELHHHGLHDPSEGSHQAKCPHTEQCAGHTMLCVCVCVSMCMCKHVPVCASLLLWQRKAQPDSRRTGPDTDRDGVGTEGRRDKQRWSREKGKRNGGGRGGKRDRYRDGGGRGGRRDRGGR